MQQFEKAILERSSRSRSQITAKMAAVEDDSEKDKGTDSEELEDEDENYAPKKRPVSPYVLISRDASIMILRNTFRPMQGKVLWPFCKINLMKNDASRLVLQSLLS